MRSGHLRHRIRVKAIAGLLVIVPMLAATQVQANPVTVDYKCRPALPKGDRISVDYNSGYKSVTIEFPNGQRLNMPLQRSGSGFRYGEGNVVIYGKGERTITLEVAGQPSRDCTNLMN